MKKRAVILLCILCIGLLTGCGKNESHGVEEIVLVAETAEIAVETTETATEAPTEATTEPTEVTEPVVEETEEPTEPATEPEEEGEKGVVCNTKSLNVRSAPGVANKRVAKLTRGTEVTVYETVKKYGALWGRIDEGWVCMDYIKLGGAEHSSRPASPTKKTDQKQKDEPTVPTEPQHEHSYQKAVTAPTCTEKGFTAYTCSCGDSYKDDYVDALGHHWSDWKTTTQPTETVEGKAERSCSNCSEKETKSLPKLIPDHSHKYSEKVTKEPTCTSAGTKTFTCSCGDSYTESISKIGHSYADQVTAPTCTKKGFTTHTCGKCGDSYRDSYQNATGHNWSSWITEKEPTESNTGLKSRTCSNCGEKETQTIDKLPSKPAECKHDYTVSSQADATCTADGSKTFQCTKCGDTKTEKIAATGHQFGSWVTVKEPTESENGKAERTCSKCSEKEYKSLDKLPTKPNGCAHDWTDWVTQELPTTEKPGKESRYCTKCWEQEIRTIPQLDHCYHEDNPNFFGKDREVAPTCTEDGYWTTKCTACGEAGPNKPSYQPATGHHYTVTDQKNASCAENGYVTKSCDVCGYSVTETLEGGHDWDWNMWKDPNGYMREYWICSDKDWRWYPEDGTDLFYAFKDHVERDHDGVFYLYSYANDIEYVGEPDRFWFECTHCGKIVESEYGDSKPPVFD